MTTLAPSGLDEMVYSQERLTRALQLFHISEPYRRKRGLRADNLDRHLYDRAEKYRLRWNGSAAPISASLWMDHDDSGDYQPGRKQAPTVVLTPSKRKRGAMTSGNTKTDADGGSSKAKRPKWTKGRQTGEQLIVTFTFRNDTSKCLLEKLKLAECEKNGHALDNDDDVGPSEWTKMGGSFAKRSSFLSQSYALRSKIAPTPPSSGNSGMLLNDGSDTNAMQDSQCLLSKTPDKRRFAACTPCRSRKERCSLKKRDRGPCEACIKAGLSCTFDGLKSIHIGSEPISVKGPGDLLTPPSSALAAIDIFTSWAHPIIFNHIGGGQNPCDFCDDYRYGMLGLGRAQVKVRRLTDDTGYLELGGGHRSQGHRQTKMCRSCALDRLNIVRCSHQVIEVFADLNEDDFDFETARKDLFASGIEKKEACTLWCSICVSPAFYMCFTCQETDKDGHQLSKGSEEAYGCGLVLCRECAGTLEALGGSLEQAKTYLQGTSNLRADFEFLLSDSDLSRVYANHA